MTSSSEVQARCQTQEQIPRLDHWLAAPSMAGLLLGTRTPPPHLRAAYSDWQTYGVLCRAVVLEEFRFKCIGVEAAVPRDHLKTWGNMTLSNFIILLNNRRGI